MARSFAPHESGEPVTIEAETPADCFEVFCRAMFNAGLAWQVVEAMWPHMTEVFAGWDPETVAGFGDDEIAAILDDPDAIQSSRKVPAVVRNARTFLDLTDEHGTFLDWTRSFDDFDALEAGLVDAFTWIGPFSAYWTMYTLDEPTPPYGDWCRAHDMEPPPGM